jgi:hypothetical protein
MAKKIILIVLVILGSSFSTSRNEIKAMVKASPAPGSPLVTSLNSHRQRTPYRVISSRYVSRSSIRRVTGPGNCIRMKFLQNGVDNTDIEDLSIQYDSGVEYHMGNVFGLDFTRLPLYVKVTYKSWNSFHAVQVDVVYEFAIFQPGTWEVSIWN